MGGWESISDIGGGGGRDGIVTDPCGVLLVSPRTESKHFQGGIFAVYM